MLDIGLEIRILRERLQVSAKELAEKVGVSQSQISRLEKGQRRIDTQVLRKIADALGVEPSYFFGESAAVPEAGEIPAPVPAAIGRLIRSERRRRHVSAEDLAGKVGAPKTVIQSIEVGKREASPELLDRILKTLKLSPSVLIEAQQKAIRALEAQVERLNSALSEVTHRELKLAAPSEDAAIARRGIPVFRTDAGYPSQFDAGGRPIGDVADYLYLPDLGDEAAFALRAVDDSMESPSAESFREGDLLVFSDATLRSRDFAFVRVADESAVFRQVFFESGAAVRLQPLNLSYPAATLERSAILGTWVLAAHVARCSE